MKIVVEFDNITRAQMIAMEDLFAKWVQLGQAGSSRWTSFFADGDGNFRPKIKIINWDIDRIENVDKQLNSWNVRSAHYIDTEKLWRHIKLKVEPNETNGLTETQWRDIHEVYMMDFDAIAWALSKREEEK